VVFPVGQSPPGTAFESYPLNSFYPEFHEDISGNYEKILRSYRQIANRLRLPPAGPPPSGPPVGAWMPLALGASSLIATFNRDYFSEKGTDSYADPQSVLVRGESEERCLRHVPFVNHSISS